LILVHDVADSTLNARYTACSMQWLVFAQIIGYSRSVLVSRISLWRAPESACWFKQRVTTGIVAPWRITASIRGAPISPPPTLDYTTECSSTRHFFVETDVDGKSLNIIDIFKKCRAYVTTQSPCYWNWPWFKGSVIWNNHHIWHSSHISLCIRELSRLDYDAANEPLAACTCQDTNNIICTVYGTMDLNVICDNGMKVIWRSRSWLLQLKN